MVLVDPLSLQRGRPAEYYTVKNGSSFRKAAEQFNVPVTTVRDRYHSKYTDGKHVPGPSSALGLEQEESLKNHLLHMAKIGYGLSKK